MVKVRALPGRADLGHLRRQAKSLLRAARGGDAVAGAGFEELGVEVTLAGAQLLVARGYGFSSWARLKAELDRRAYLDEGDVAGLRRLVERDPSLAVEVGRWADDAGEHTIDPLGYLCLARFHGLFDHDRVEALAAVLLAAGAPADGNPDAPEPTLVTAASYGEAGVARLLIESGADLEAVGFAVPGGTALSHAVAFGMVEVIDVLAGAGAVVHDVVEAAGVGDLSGWRLDECDHDERARALHAAARCDRLGVIDELLGVGVEVDAVTDGMTALHAAAWEGKHVAVAHLLERGADPAVRNSYGGTALDACGVRRSQVGDGWGHDRVIAILEPATHRDDQR